MEGQLNSVRLRRLKTAWISSEIDKSTEKPLLLFLHGFPDSPETWSFQMEEFGRDFQVICPFARGSFPSEKAKDVSRYGLASYGLDLLNILREVDPSGKRPLYIIGHDLGAVHAWHLADLVRARLKGLVIFNGLSLRQAAERLATPGQIMKSWYIFLFMLPNLPETLFKKFPKKLLKFAHDLGEASKESRLSLKEVHGSLVNPVNQYRAFVRGIPGELFKNVRPLRCPVLVLWGKEDSFLMTPKKSELAQFAPNLSIRIMEGNHWIHRDRHEEVNQILRDFFNGSRKEVVQ